MKNKIILIAFIATVLIQCTKKHPCDYDFPDNVNNSSVTVTFKDKRTNQYLFLYYNPRTIYNIDTVKIFNPLREKMFLINGRENEIHSSGIIDKYWKINFGPIFDFRTDSSAFLAPIYKDFIVHYNFNTRDTLTTYFKALPTPCGSTFEFLKVYHKGKIIDSIINDTRIILTHYKN